MTERRACRPQRRDWAIAILTGVAIVVLALLGADKPPPIGFLAVVAAAVGLSVAIAMSLPRWRRVSGSRWRRTGRAASEGAATGVALWLIAVLLPFSGEPTISMTVIDHLIGAAVAASLGGLGAALLARIA
jgi:uncharacterized membrane protein YccC